MNDHMTRGQCTDMKIKVTEVNCSNYGYDLEPSKTYDKWSDVLDAIKIDGETKYIFELVENE